MRSILFAGRRNAARSIMAETCFNAASVPGWRAFSAGWEPRPDVDRLALTTLARHGFATDGLNPKPVAIFTQAGAPAIELTVFLDEELPSDAESYPGQHESWRVADPGKRGAYGCASVGAGYERALGIITARVSSIILSGRLLHMSGNSTVALAS